MKYYHRIVGGAYELAPRLVIEKKLQLMYETTPIVDSSPTKTRRKQTMLRAMLLFFREIVFHWVGVGIVEILVLPKNFDYLEIGDFTKQD